MKHLIITKTLSVSIFALGLMMSPVGAQAQAVDYQQKIQQAHQERVEAAKERHQENVEAVKEHHQERVEEAKERHQENVEAVKEHHQARIQDLKEKRQDHKTDIQNKILEKKQNRPAP